VWREATKQPEKGGVYVKDEYVRLNEYARLLSELNEHEAYSPDDAWLVFANKIDELLNELAAVGTK